jgi:hypothetical protein
MLQDETCFFLAADFDDNAWQTDARAFLATATALGLPAALERSRSGNGGHAWFFFEQAVPAALARKLGSHILTETMEHRPELGLKSYDRLFPNQDTLPKGGFGNLIALPLQKAARQNGNSVFLDDDFRPFEDQWAFLASIQRIGRGHLQSVVREAEAKGRVIGVRRALIDEEDEDPWVKPRVKPASRRSNEAPISGPLPLLLELVLGDEIYFQKETLVPALKNRLVRLAAFQNPEFYRAQAMRLPTYDKPRIISCAEEHPKHIALPRGCLDDVCQLLKNLDIQPRLRANDLQALH